jgi:hypothetical protein
MDIAVSSLEDDFGLGTFLFNSLNLVMSFQTIHLCRRRVSEQYDCLSWYIWKLLLSIKYTVSPRLILQSFATWAHASRGGRIWFSEWEDILYYFHAVRFFPYGPNLDHWQILISSYSWRQMSMCLVLWRPNHEIYTVYPNDRSWLVPLLEYVFLLSSNWCNFEKKKGKKFLYS